MQSFSKQVSNPIQQGELKTLLNYSPITGEFVWKVKPSLGVPVGKTAGHKSKAGYIQIRIGNQMHYAHRLAFLYMTGSFPKEKVDHINGQTSDTSWANLREATALDNARNACTSKNSQSGVLGVHWIADRKKWRATIGVGYRSVYLGEHTTLAAAILARKEGEHAHGFHPNHGRNFL